MYKILVINPGSTSTKFAIYENEGEKAQYTIRHSIADLKGFDHVYDQLDYRYNLIMDRLKKENVDIKSFSSIIGRGGMLPPVQSGVYFVNEDIMYVLKNAIIGEHASNLGAFLAYKVAEHTRCTALIADPVTVDEFSDIARISGLPEFPRISKFHALNHKAAARHHAKQVGKKYEELDLIVAHLGGGITVGSHQKGRVVDVNQGLDGYGPFSPERSGTIDAGQLVKMCFSGKYTEAELLKMLAGNGGLIAHLGTNDVREAEKKMILGNDHAKLILDAMIYTISKEIMSNFAVFKGKNDGVILTGGIAFSEYIVNGIKEHIEPYADVYVYAGEDELRSLALSALRYLKGERVKIFAYTHPSEFLILK